MTFVRDILNLGNGSRPSSRAESRSPSRSSTPESVDEKAKDLPSRSELTVPEKSELSLALRRIASNGKVAEMGVELGGVIRSVELSMDEQKKIANTPHIYTLTDSRLSPAEKKEKNNLRFLVVGCAGDGGDPQARVAKAMAEAKEKPDFIIILGDNFYDWGVDSPTDPAFKTKFDEVYKICGVPCFIIPGNHDYNIWSRGTKHGERDEKKIIAQVMHNYLDKDGKFDPVKIEQYKKAELDLAELMKSKQIWNMPSRFYALKPAEGVELVLLDSNTLMTEYVELMIRRESEQEVDEKDRKETKFENGMNQAEWLEGLAKESSGVLRMIFDHHPLSTIGKRAMPNNGDETNYLKPEHLDWLRAKGFTGNYNEMVRQLLLKLGVNYDMCFSAHDHFQYYIVDENKKLNQVVAGGGGGTSQTRASYSDPEKVPYCETNFGYVDVTIDLTKPKKDSVIAFNNLEGGRYQFAAGSRVAQHEEKEETEDLILLRKFVLEACDEFINKKLKEAGKTKKDDKLKAELKSEEKLKQEEKAKSSDATLWGYMVSKTVNTVSKTIDTVNKTIDFANKAVTTVTNALHMFGVPPEFLVIDKIKNYFQEFKKKEVSDCVAFLKCAPVSFVTLLDARFKNTKYGSFEKFRETFPVIARSAPKAVPEKQDVRPIGASLGGSPDFRGALIHSPRMFREAMQEIAEDELREYTPSPSASAKSPKEENDVEFDGEDLLGVVGSPVLTPISSSERLAI